MNLQVENEHVGGFENYSKTQVTKVAYLIGVPDEYFDDRGIFEKTEYEELIKNEKATVIRHLCILRTQFLRYYTKIKTARSEMKQLEEIEVLSSDSIRYLRARNIEISIANEGDPNVYTAYINQYIQDLIDGIKGIFPEWVKFEYIRKLFLMSGAYAGKNGTLLKDKKSRAKIFGVIKGESEQYNKDWSVYPYSLYLVWPRPFREKDGNILYNDNKFLGLLYANYGDSFRAREYVIGATEDTKNEIYTFIEDAAKVAMFVDCENVDVYALAATILGLDAGVLGKIEKIVLYNDINTCLAWDHLEHVTQIRILREETQRILENKSVVDFAMMLGIVNAHQNEDFDSVILASSDSDFVSLIQNVPTARFFVLNEYKKTSEKAVEVLDGLGVPHCYMSDFAKERVQKFKNEVLLVALEEIVEKFNCEGVFDPITVPELLGRVFWKAGVICEATQLEKEKESFYKQYLRDGITVRPVEQDGVLRLRMEIKKK